MTVTASYDLFVPVRRRPRLDAPALAAALADLGLEVELPPSARMNPGSFDYIPARVTFERGTVIRTGFTLSCPDDWPERGVEPDEATIDGELGSFTVYAFNAPEPRDENELPLAWFVAAAIAGLGGGAVIDPQDEAEPLEGAALERLLREKKADFDAGASGWEEYPYDLFVALEEGDDRRARAALVQAPGMDAADAHGNTLLMLAVRGKLPALAAELVARGADVNLPNRYGSTPLDEALKAGDDDSLRLLLARSADPAPVLIRRAALGTLAEVERMLDAGVPIDTAGSDGWTPLMIATYEGHLELASRLIERGARLDAVNRDGVTPLMVAVDQQHRTLVEHMLAKGADPNHRMRDGATALMWAKERKDSAIVALLRRHGAR